MDVQCERCNTEYEFDDALVSGRGTTVKCMNCGHQFKVRRPDVRGETPDRWHVRTIEGRELVFTSLRELQRAILARQVDRADTLTRGDGPPRALGAISELEPFFDERKTSSPAPRPSQTARTAPEVPRARTAASQPPRPEAKRTLVGPAFAPPPPPPRDKIPSRPPPPASASRATRPFGLGDVTPVPAPPPGEMRPRIDTLRPPLTASAPPPASPSAMPRPLPLGDGPSGLAPPPPPPMPTGVGPAYAPTEQVPIPTSMAYAATELSPAPPPPAMPPPTDPIRRTEPMGAIDPMRDAMSSLQDASEITPMHGRPRRVGGWVVAAVLLVGAGVLAAAVAKPYLAAGKPHAGAQAPLDPRAQQFLVDGERALADFDLDAAKENFDKASALAEKDPRVLLDVARLAEQRADVPWLRLRLLPPDAADDQRTTKASLDELAPKARRAAEDALAAAPEDPAAVRSKVDALRIAGDRDAARALVTKIIANAAQPETAYVLAALDLAEPEPLWPMVIERLRLAAGAEGNAGRARAALIYALARSGDVAGAKAELDRLAGFTRPHPLLAALRAYVAHAPAVKVDGGVGIATTTATVDVSALPHPAAGAKGRAAGGRAEHGEGFAGASDPRALLAQAAAATQAHDYDRARALYSAALAQNPSDSEALAGLGDVSHAIRDLPGAITYYKRALAVNPVYLPALVGEADAQWESGDHDAAQKVYRDIVDRFPEGSYPARVKSRAEGGSTAPGAPPAAAPTSTTTPAPTSTPSSTTGGGGGASAPAANGPTTANTAAPSDLGAAQ